MFSMHFELASSLYSGFDVDGQQIAQHDGFGAKPGVGHSELHHPFGFISRPRDPEVDSTGRPLSGKSCSVLVGKIGEETHYWLASDPRYVPKIPQLKKGGAAMYSAAGSFSVLDGEDGTLTTYIPVPGDKAHVITAGLDGADKPFIGIEHANGMAVTMLEHSLVLKNAAGSVYIEIKDDQVVINGNVVCNGGATFGDPAGAKPLALAPLLIAYLNAQEEAIIANMKAIGAGALANGPGASETLRASLGALSSAKAAIAALKTSGA